MNSQEKYKELFQKMPEILKAAADYFRQTDQGAQFEFPAPGYVHFHNAFFICYPSDNDLWVLALSVPVGFDPSYRLTEEVRTSTKERLLAHLTSEKMPIYTVNRLKDLDSSSQHDYPN